MVRASLIVSFAAAAAAAATASGATKQRGWRTRTGAAPPPVASFEPLRYVSRKAPGAASMRALGSGLPPAGAASG